MHGFLYAGVSNTQALAMIYIIVFTMSKCYQQFVDDDSYYFMWSSFLLPLVIDRPTLASPRWKNHRPRAERCMASLCVGVSDTQALFGEEMYYLLTIRCTRSLDSLPIYVRLPKPFPGAIPMEFCVEADLNGRFWQYLRCALLQKTPCPTCNLRVER